MGAQNAFEKQADLFVHTFAQLMSGRLERRALTISRGEFGLLMYLSEQSDGVTSTMIQDAMQIGAGGVANLLKGLVEKGLVSKEQDSADRRANSVKITEKGYEVFQARYEQIKRTVMIYMDQMGLEDSTALNEIMQKILNISRVTKYSE